MILLTVCAGLCATSTIGCRTYSHFVFLTYYNVKDGQAVGHTDGRMNGHMDRQLWPFVKRSSTSGTDEQTGKQTERQTESQRE